MKAITKINFDNDVIEIFDSNSLFLIFEIAPPGASSEIIAQLGETINKLITNDQEFIKILGKVFGLKRERKIEFLKALGDHLKNVVTQGETLFNALALIHNSDDQAYLLEIIGRKGLRNCIKTIDHLLGCFEWLYGRMDIVFCDLIGWDYVIRFVRNGEALGRILKYIDEEEEQQLLEMIGWNRVFDCVRSTSDLYYILNGLDPKNEKRFIELIPYEKLMIAIPYEDVLDKICHRYLTDADSIILKTRYGEALEKGYSFFE